MSRGFSLLEMLVVIAVLIVISTVVISRMSAAKSQKAAITAADNILFTLEEAKQNAVAGKYGTAHGVHFASSTYTSFSGTSYSPSGEYNRSFSAPGGIVVATQLSGGAVDVVFARLTGAPSVTGTIVVEYGESAERVISIGPGGDISIGE